jgi:hypothetical protein
MSHEKMQCMQIDKYEHEHDGGSKNKMKLRLISNKLIIIGWFDLLSIKKKNKNIKNQVASREALHLKS